MTEPDPADFAAPADPVAAGYQIRYGVMWLRYVAAGAPYGLHAPAVARWAGEQLQPHLPAAVVAALVAAAEQAGLARGLRATPRDPEG